MARSADVPYPPSPDDVPEGYTDYSPEYRSKQNWLLVWVYVVFMVYLAMVFASGTAVVWFTAAGIKGWFCCAGFPLALLSLGVFVYLVSGFFAKTEVEKQELMIEVTEDDHPKLFAFIQRLSSELGVDEPYKVHVFPEANAAALTPLGLVNLFAKPKRELRVGIGLINLLTLSEFKAVLAHELGHFAQHGGASVYTNRAAVILGNMIRGHGTIDRFAERLKRNGNLFGILLYAFVWVIRFPLWLTAKFYGDLQHKLAREAEFHADRVAAAMAGSNAIVHGLFRARVADETFSHALSDLTKAADHKLFTADLFYHQHAAGDILRRQKKDPEYGKPPKLDTPHHGKRVQVFDEDAEEDHPEDDYHPPMHEREEHVKSPFVPADDDNRSAWILFDNPVELRERLTYKMYRAIGLIKKGTPLDDPKVVQKFIDDEHHETTYDERYQGAYDSGRYLRPGDLDDLDELIRKEPWEDARLANVYEKLYGGLQDKVDELKDVNDELRRLRKNNDGELTKKMKRKIKDLERDREDLYDWFGTFDRRVYLVFVQMSYRVDHDAYYELTNRYRFHMAVQGICKTAEGHFNEAEMYLAIYNAMQSGNAPQQVIAAHTTETLHVFREARKGLKVLLREAREINMPAMKNFEEGERLAEFLLDEDLIREAGESGVSGKWIDKLFRQLSEVARKSSRLHFKSLGQILTLQDDIAARFLITKGFKQAKPTA
ncbi:MAG: M48 family metallopeptidase [Fimbriiglobus sp.]|jgi:Zn-dependent protease with chaperone function|nr:M48 family metallopeptidase [Fimbriiglobus sp.]